jgi:hypothetical protein
MRHTRHTEQCIAEALAYMYLTTIRHALESYEFWDKRLAPDERRLIDRRCSCRANGSEVVEKRVKAFGPAADKGEHERKTS